MKVIKTDNLIVRDAIIRATNNQTEVEQQSLHATDKIQRDIEAVLVRSDWYYDRRKNHYANQGKPLERIVSPLYVAAGVLGVLLQSPSRASRLKQRFMRRPDAYRHIFSDSIDLNAWPKLVSVLKFVDSELVKIRSARVDTEGAVPEEVAVSHCATHRGACLWQILVQLQTSRSLGSDDSVYRRHCGTVANSRTATWV